MNEVTIEAVVQPKEITLDGDSGIHVASFGYYDGIKYAKELGLSQTGRFSDVFNYTHFIVCCGDVMVRVKPEAYPLINRRTI